MTARRPPGRRLRGQGGETLIELLATVTVMGIAVVAVLFALAAGIAFSTTHRNQANAAVAVTAAAEAVKAANPVSCGSLGSYANAFSTATLPNGWTTANLSITGATCSGSLQTIPITATSPGGKSSVTVQVVKRGP